MYFVYVFVMVQYDDNLESAAPVCVYLYVYLGWFNMVTIRWPQQWCARTYVCVFMMVLYGDTLDTTVQVCNCVCVFVMVQYGDNLETTALLYVYLCVCL